MPIFITDKEGKVVEQIPTGQRQNAGSETEGTPAAARQTQTGAGTKTTANATGAQGSEAGPTRAANAAGTPARTPAGTEANATATGAAQAGTGQTPQTRPRATTLAERQALEQTAALMKQAKPVQLTPEEKQGWRQSVGTGTPLLPWPEDEPMPSAGRVAASGYAADMGPILARLEAGRIDPEPYRREMERIDAMLPQAVEEYRRTGRNPLADVVLAQMKPKRRADEENKLRQQAKLLALNNALSLIGKGIAASAGIRPAPVDNQPIYDIQERLRRLDDIYRQEGLRYDQNRLLSALRKDQANQQAAQAAVEALQKQRDSYAEMYSDAIQNNRDIAAKMADKALEASKYGADVAFREQQQRETQRHNRASEGLQLRRLKYAKEKDITKLRNYATGKYADLTPEVMADISGYVARIIHGRKSAGKDPYGNTIQGENPMPFNSRVTDEELKELQDGLDIGKLSPAQHGILTRLYNEMENGDLYDPENDTPFYMPSEPQNMYSEANRPEYENWLKYKLEQGILAERLYDNTITIDHARRLFPGLAQAPDKEVEKVLRNAGWQVEKE